MQEAFFLIPREILQFIFKILPFVSQIKLSEVSKSWEQAFRDPKFKFDIKEAGSKEMLSLFFGGKSSPRIVRRRIESVLSQKVDINELEKNPETSLFNSILFILMSHINKENVDRMTKSMNIIEQDRKIISYYDVGIDLMCSIKLTKYANSRQEYRKANRSLFQERCRENMFFVNFNGANLSRENLTKANFPGSSFIGTDLAKSILCQANFTDTNLSEANLRGCCVDKDTSFKGANLMGGDLRDVKGIPTFDRYTILIGAKMDIVKGFCLKKAAENSGAIFTLADLAQRIKEKPDAFSNSDMLFIKAFKILLKNKIEDLEEILLHDRDNLVIAKLEMLKRLLPRVEDAEKNYSIAVLREAIKNVMENKNMRNRETKQRKTQYEIFSEPRAVVSGTCKEIGFFSDHIRTDSQDIIDDAKAGLDILGKMNNVSKSAYVEGNAISDCTIF